MFYSAGSIVDGYNLAYAESVDGLAWVRKDRDVGIERSTSGWDCSMQAYPAVVLQGKQTYLFYNGNNYGDDGFGFATLVHW
jgi:hypothetical protein